MNKKALLLFSGGLDSILSTKILLDQGVKVTPICFESFFFNCRLAKKSAKDLGLKMKIVDVSKDHLEIVKKPKHGRGRGMNPCVDCHILMIKKAKEILEKENYNFLVTGEVLGERPFSQNTRVFRLAEKESGLEGLILRPLSAKLLKPTIPEKEGWVERKKLFAIEGKSRRPHLNLAEKLGIKKFPTPAGGCLLADLEYSKKLKELSRKVPNFDGPDCLLLKRGRTFWKDSFLITVGRDEQENKEIQKMKRKGDVLLESENFPGPIVLIRGFGRKIKKELIDRGTEILLHYTKYEKIPEDIIIKIENGI